MSAHTPGPWIIHSKAKTAVVGSKGFVVAACGGHENNTVDREALWNELCANARLIAAAPELLAALERLVPFDGVTSAKSDDIAFARAAIAKARGAA